MREPATIYAWISHSSATIYAWTTWAIHSFLGITFDQVCGQFSAAHGLPLVIGMWVMDGLAIKPCSVASTCTCP